MSAYDGASIGTASGNPAAPFVGPALTGSSWLPQSTGPDYAHGGCTALAPIAADWSGVPQLRPAIASAVLQVLVAAQVVHVPANGSHLIGRFIQVSAVYRNSDRLTIAGYARDLSGNPLRGFQLHFIGLTVQDHFFGAGTDLDGVYVAFLDVGDTYDAYAFHTATGITFRLESMQSGANQTNLSFRRITKRGTGEGLFRQGA